jgi:hypothetical protein
VSILDRLERHFGRFAVPNLSLFLVIGQVGVYLALLLGRVDATWFLLVPQFVLGGQWWRLATFILMPPPAGLIFIAFAWYMFYLMGSALEGYWGDFRYNLFLLLGYGLTIGLAFLDPAGPVSNSFLAGSVFLAFAYLNPNFELALFLILPIRIKWLALFTWGVYLFQFVTGGWPARLQIAAAVGNFFIFFGRDIWLTARMHRRRMSNQAERAATVVETGGVRHRCRVCGKTDLSNPELDFRYCSKCAGDQCYCPEHIFNHVHVTEPPPPSSS